MYLIKKLLPVDSQYEYIWISIRGFPVGWKHAPAVLQTQTIDISVHWTSAAVWSKLGSDEGCVV